jgi:hypothetical protein
LVFECGFGPELYSIIEGFGDGKEVNEFHEAVKGLYEVADDGCPSNDGWIVEFNLVHKWDMCIDRV